MRPWSPGAHPNSHPVPSRRSIAWFRQCPSQQQLCVPAVHAALLALGAHKLCPSHNPTGRNHMARDLATWGAWKQRTIIQTSFTKLAKATKNALVTRCSFSVFAWECTLNARNRRTLRIFQHTKTLLLHCRHLVQCRYRPAI
ncbi:hypothetical protein AVEN_273266-1 [Araneus ventricosus]|uniref:Uncharacterized protein n=1 Tax=Araneus ventricosus TaxID=182803 RepID=A0A4Y2LTX0_ARAVE|nr:hypothetical protein AVEN_273266-1 [Araneus ventricosus]